MYMELLQVLEGKGLGLGGLSTTNDDTLFQVVSRKDHSVRTLQTSGFIFGHVINSWEDAKGDIFIDLTWYEAGNKTTMGWFNRWFLEYMQDANIREAWPRAQVRRYRLGADGSVSNWALF